MKTKDFAMYFVLAALIGTVLHDRETIKILVNQVHLHDAAIVKIVRDKK